MKRLGSLVAAAGIAFCVFVAAGRGASATPFSDVPGSSFAYAAIASLAADGLLDGYPDGAFRGDRPLTRYEMAVIVARVVAKVQAAGLNSVSKTDLATVQKLVDSLKDELDSLGVRVDNLEDSIAALDRRTQFAQRIQFHGSLSANTSLRQRNELPRSIANTTGAPVTSYYGATIAPTTDAAPHVGPVDPLVNAYISTPDSNDPLQQQSSGVRLRYDDRFDLSYQVSENLAVSIPIHILNFNYGGEFQAQTGHVSIQPDIVVNVKSAGALTNLTFRAGQIDDMRSSRTSLTFRAPQYATQGPLYENPVQPYEKGFSIGATVNGLTDVQFNFTRVDQTLLNTQTNVLDPQGTSAPDGVNEYLWYVTRPQPSYVQTGAAGGPGTVTSNSFSAGDAPLTQVFLTRKAVAGTVYIAAFNGTTFDSSGRPLSGTGAGAAPNFAYNDQYNSIVFASPLPAGSRVTIAYSGLSVANNDNWQRYHVSARVNQKIAGFPGAEIGVSFSRIYDFDDLQTTGDLTSVQANAVTGYGLVSDTVFGIDAQLPLPFFFNRHDPTSAPQAFGEIAHSSFSADYRTTPVRGDSAGVVGLRFKLAGSSATLQYQSVGSNFMAGAPVQFYGNAPALYANARLPYYPSFFGFGNNLALNTQFDAAVRGSAGYTSSAGNPNLTFLDVVFNPFRASGPTYFSAFTPNSQGFSGSATVPFRVGGVAFAGRVSGESLREITPNAAASTYYGPVYQTTTPETFKNVSGGVSFNLPVFAKRVAVSVNASYERLSRPDKTPQQYFPIDPTTQAFDLPSVAAAASVAAGGSPVAYYPNYTDVRHSSYIASAAIPLTKGVSLGLNYSTQRFGGSQGTTLGQSISERKDQYAGSLTYSIPNTNSELTFLARKNTYVDDVLPNFNFSQNRQDLTFTIRF